MSPFAALIPALHAPAKPKLVGFTTSLISGKFLLINSTELSVEPLSTTMIS
jgi:hypothetical protein